MSPKQIQSARILAQLTREVIRGTEYPHTENDWPQATMIAVHEMRRLYPSLSCSRPVIDFVRTMMPAGAYA